MGEGAALLAFVDPQAIANHRLLLRLVPCPRKITTEGTWKRCRVLLKKKISEEAPDHGRGSWIDDP